MYDYGYSYGYGLIGGNTYNPLINYDWSTTTTSGLRYLKDVGSTPTYNASMYFGRGAYFNGVDQTITVPINTTIQTVLKRVNGVVTISETSQTLTNYVISGLGVHKDYYLFTRLLTTAEKDSYTNTPELFYAMAQADSTCVLNMPMCETDRYVRNMKSYSEVSTYLASQSNDFSTLNGFSPLTWLSEDIAKFESNTRVYKSTGLDTTKRIVKVSVDSIDSGYITVFSDGSTAHQISGVGTFYFINTSPDIGIVYAYNNGNAVNCQMSLFEVFEISGIYPITNYTSSVRDNAKNLRYGLQTCKFVRDSLGVIQSASDYLECDGVGYSDTGNFLDTQNDFSIEFIGLFKTSTTEQAHGVAYMDAYNRITFSMDSVGKLFSRCGGTIISYNSNSFYNICTSLTLTFNRVLKQFKLYFNGVYAGQNINNNFTLTKSMFTLGSQGLVTYQVNGDVRLFKVHDKALTQEEVTANYNSYVAKGLLS